MHRSKTNKYMDPAKLTMPMGLFYLLAMYTPKEVCGACMGPVTQTVHYSFTLLIGFLHNLTDSKTGLDCWTH